MRPTLDALIRQESGENVTDEQEFDFKAHGKEAVTAYLPLQSHYRDLALVVKRILLEAVRQSSVKVHSVEAREKNPESLSRKAAQQSSEDPSKPKYDDPLKQITDLAAVRVITFFPGTLQQVDRLIEHEFQVIERSDKGAELLEEDRFGYQSIHYLVSLSSDRVGLPEYAPYAEGIVEIQVRTILQHAWAEIEHDIQYKSAAAIPDEIRRRFMALAGMLEIADREFQAIQDEDKALVVEVRKLVKAGNLESVEITPDSLKAFLDKRLGSDKRMSRFSYEWTVKLLKKLGFRTLEQVAACIGEYDDDKVSRVISGGRQGQLSRFECLLLAGMGDRYIERHFWANEDWHAKMGVRARPLGSRSPELRSGATIPLAQNELGGWCALRRLTSAST
jgi:putative GTP pyrophosphokinase